MKIHRVFWFNVIMVLALMASNLGSVASADVFTSGTLTPFTPFDGPLSSAGFFEVASNASAGDSASVENLFFRARSFRYVHQLHWQSPEETESKGSGDCKDKSIWLYAQLKRNGYTDVYLVLGRYGDVESTFHAWVSYRDSEGNTYILDPAKQKRPWRTSDFSSDRYQPLYCFNGESRYRCS